MWNYSKIMGKLDTIDKKKSLYLFFLYLFLSNTLRQHSSVSMRTYLVLWTLSNVNIIN